MFERTGVDNEPRQVLPDLSRIGLVGTATMQDQAGTRQLSGEYLCCNARTIADRRA